MLQQLKPRILCIDDESSVGELLQSIFQKTGEFLVEVETDALKAVQHARIFRPDVIFVDIKMFGRDGLAVARALRKEPWLCHRPMIFYSGLHNVEELALKAGLGGPTEFLQKGVPIGVIEETVRRCAAERLDFFKSDRSAV